MNLKISNRISRQQPFYESNSVAGIEPYIYIEGGSANDFVTFPTRYSFECVVDLDVAVVDSTG